MCGNISNRKNIPWKTVTSSGLSGSKQVGYKVAGFLSLAVQGTFAVDYAAGTYVTIYDFSAIFGTKFDMGLGRPLITWGGKAFTWGIVSGILKIYCLEAVIASDTLTIYDDTFG